MMNCKAYPNLTTGEAVMEIPPLSGQTKLNGLVKHPTQQFLTSKTILFESPLFILRMN
jgi:hypothetical protein